MSIYTGVRLAELSCLVYRDGQLLLPDRSLCVRKHSPAGFEWGYAGSGPAQLALAILLEETTMGLAASLYMRFKFKVIAKLPHATWVLTSREVQAFIDNETPWVDDSVLDITDPEPPKED